MKQTEIERILNFFKCKNAVDSVSIDKLLELQSFCEKVTELDVERYINSFAFHDLSEVQRLTTLIIECNHQLISDSKTYEVLFEMTPETWAFINSDEVREPDEKETELLCQLYEANNKLQEFYDEEEKPEDTEIMTYVANDDQDIELINNNWCPCLPPKSISNLCSKVIIARNLTLDVIERYLKMARTVSYSCEIEWDIIVKQLLDILNHYSVFYSMDQETLLNLLSLDKSYRTVIPARGRKVYMYALVCTIAEMGPGKIASKKELLEWKKKAIDYFELSSYTKKPNFLTRNTKNHNICQFNDELKQMLKEK